MNSKFIATAVVTLAALSSASAFAASSSQYAEPAEFSRNTMTTSSVSRDQVRAEYFAARQGGMVPAGQEFDIKPASKAGSNLTRGQVRAEYFTARQSGMLPVGQEFDVNNASKAGSNQSRAQAKSAVITSGTTDQNKL